MDVPAVDVPAADVPAADVTAADVPAAEWSRSAASGQVAHVYQPGVDAPEPQLPGQNGRR